MTGREKYRCMSSADLFVSVTTAPYEAFPVSNLEAMACYLPVVTTRWAGNPEAVCHRENGFLINVHPDESNDPVPDTVQLRESISQLLTDDDLRQKFASRSGELSGQYDYRAVMPQFERLLKERNGFKKSERDWKEIEEKTIYDFKGMYAESFLTYMKQLGFAPLTYRRLHEKYIENRANKDDHKYDDMKGPKKKAGDVFREFRNYLNMFENSGSETAKEAGQGDR